MTDTIAIGICNSINELYLNQKEGSKDDEELERPQYSNGLSSFSLCNNFLKKEQVDKILYELSYLDMINLSGCTGFEKEDFEEVTNL